jgi:DNA-directed RNA polymerase specialized sigma24 family protein
MTYEDIAKEMNMKLNSVKVTLFRAKAQMKNELLKSDLIKEHVRSMKSDGR